MVKIWLTLLVLMLGLCPSAPVQAGVVCAFTDSGVSGSDCLGQTWNINNVPIWSLPPPGQGNGGQAFAGSVATDFHFHCLAGCGVIRNGSSDPTYFFSAGNLEFWHESVNAAGDTIDFNFATAGGILNTGSRFDISIAFASLDVSTFRFEAWWTDDHRRVAEPPAIGLLGLALLALALTATTRSAAGRRHPIG